MVSFRPYIKNVFYKLRLVNAFDYILFQRSYFTYRRKNVQFKNENPELIFPPDYFLYETYKLDYELFYKEGDATAKAIVNWAKNYISTDNGKILDWGCGVSRTVIHLPKYTSEAEIHGCDINKKMISFNKNNFKQIAYSLISNEPPTSYEACYFDLIYGMSIFTHIEGNLQELWFKEINRILKVGGIFLFTTHGKFFYSKLLPFEKNKLFERGLYSKVYKQRGHRMMSTYNAPEALKKVIEKYFSILEFHAGEADRSKIGGQDLWLVKKKPKT